MSRALDTMMKNKYLLFGFIPLLFGLKFLIHNYDVYESYPTVFDLLETSLLVLLIVCFLNIVSVIIFSFLTKNKSEQWWESSENKESERRKEKWLEFCIKTFILSVPVALYGTFIYLALFQSWTHLLVAVISFMSFLLVSRYQNPEKQLSHREH